MAVQNLELGSLATIDGGALNEAFDQEMKRCREDCIDRPTVKKERRVVLVVRLKPEAKGNDLDAVNVTFEVDHSIPKLETRSYNMQAVPGGLLFNELSPDDIRQGTLDNATGPQTAVGGES